LVSCCVQEICISSNILPQSYIAKVEIVLEIFQRLSR
jgi:hypothetical protein